MSTEEDLASRAERVAASLRSLAEDVDAFGGYAEVEEVRAAALEFIRRTHPCDLSASVSVRWRECHCHGNNHEIVESPTLAGLAELLEKHKHADEDDLREVVWTLRLSSEEHAALLSSYRDAADARRERERLIDQLDLARERRSQAERALQAERSDLERLRHELNVDAVAARERAAASLEAGLRAATEAACAAETAVRGAGIKI